MYVDTINIPSETVLAPPGTETEELIFLSLFL